MDVISFVHFFSPCYKFSREADCKLLWLNSDLSYYSYWVDGLLCRRFYSRAVLTRHISPLSLSSAASLILCLLWSPPPGLPLALSPFLTLHFYSCWWRILEVFLHIKLSVHICSSLCLLAAMLNNGFPFVFLCVCVVEGEREGER